MDVLSWYVHVSGKEKGSSLLALISTYCPPVNAVWRSVSRPVSQSGNRPVAGKQPHCNKCQSRSVSKNRRGLKRLKDEMHSCVCVSAAHTD